MGWNGGRDENDLLEVEYFSNLFCPPEVTQMDGIEGSPEQANPFFSYPRSLFYLSFPPLVDYMISAFWNNGIVEQWNDDLEEMRRPSDLFSLVFQYSINPIFQHSIARLLFTDLSLSINNKFSRRQFFQPHGPKGVKFGGADSDLCPQAQLESIIESC